MISFLLCLAILVGGYFVYGKIVDNTFGPDDRETPAVRINDGVDYVVMPQWKLFLVQLLNIAGLGPIFGAMQGALWGPVVFLWITFGTIFAGGVHDYFSGMMSERNEGASIAEVTGKYLGPVMQNIMRVFSVVLLIMVGTVFAVGPAGLIVELCSQSGASGVMTSLLFCNKFAPLIQYFGVNGTKMHSWAGAVEPVYTMDYAAGLQEPSAIGLLIGYAVAAIVVTALALFLFRIRKSERAGTALAFNPIKLPVKIIICVVMGTAFAEIFKMLVYESELWFWVGLVLGTVIFHCVVEIIYAFDFRAIFRKPLQLVIILAVLCAGLLTMQADVFGYDEWLPDEGSVAAAAPMGYVGESALLSEPENIAAARQLAALGVESLNNTDENAQKACITVTFKLKNGKVKSRSYELPGTDEVFTLKKQIYQSAEYKQKAWSLFALGEVNEGYHRNIVFYTNGAAGICAGE